MLNQSKKLRCSVSCMKVQPPVSLMSVLLELNDRMSHYDNNKKKKKKEVDPKMGIRDDGNRRGFMAVI